VTSISTLDRPPPASHLAPLTSAHCSMKTALLRSMTSFNHMISISLPSLKPDKTILPLHRLSFVTSPLLAMSSLVSHGNPFLQKPRNDVLITLLVAVLVSFTETTLKHSCTHLLHTRLLNHWQSHSSFQLVQLQFSTSIIHLIHLSTRLPFLHFYQISQLSFPL